MSNLPKKALPSTETSTVGAESISASDIVERAEESRNVESGGEDTVEDEASRDEGADNASETPPDAPNRDEGDDTPAEMMIEESPDTGRSTDDDPTDGGSTDGSSDLSLSDNEPDLTAGGYIRTRSDRETKKVNYGDFHKRGAQFFQQDPGQLKSTGESDDGVKIKTNNMYANVVEALFFYRMSKRGNTNR